MFNTTQRKPFKDKKKEKKILLKLFHVMLVINLVVKRFMFVERDLNCEVHNFTWPTCTHQQQMRRMKEY